LADQVLRGDFTVFRLRARRPLVVDARRLLALALGGQPALLEQQARNP
jgi:hypothetical protein